MDPADRQRSFDDATFRVASAEDIPALVRLINAAFVVEQVAIEGDRVDPAAVQKYMQTGTFLILENRGGTLGCVYIEKRGDRGYLGLLSVEPSLQNRGIGRQLAEAAERHGRKDGCRAMDLRVISARAEIVPFYERLGFVATRTSPMPPDAPLKVPCHFIHMSKPLS